VYDNVIKPKSRLVLIYFSSYLFFASYHAAVPRSNGNYVTADQTEDLNFIT